MGANNRGKKSVGAGRLPPGVTPLPGGGYRVAENVMTSVALDLYERQPGPSIVPSLSRDQMADVGGVAISKSSVLPHYLSYQALREFAIRTPIIQAIESSRIRAIQRYGVLYSGRRGDIGVRVGHVDELRGGRQAPSGFDVYVREAERILTCPAPGVGVNSLADLLGLLGSDLSTINRPTVEIIRSAATGRMTGLRPIDGAIVYNVVDVVSARSQQMFQGMDPSKVSDEDILNRLAMSLHRDIERAEYVLVRDGIVETIYPPGVIACFPMMRTTDVRYAGYQPSLLEMALEAVAAWWATFDHENSTFRDGWFADMLLLLSSTIGADQARTLEADLIERGRGYKKDRHPIVLRGLEGSEIQKVDLGQVRTDMTYERRFAFCGALICAIYQVDPSSVGMKPFEGGQAPRLSERSREEEIENNNKAGYEADLVHLAGALTRIMQREIHPELSITIEFGRTDPVAEEKVRKSRVEYDMTRNESRLLAGDRAIGFYLTPDEYDKASEENRRRHDENVWNMTKDPVMVSQMKAIQEAQVAREQASALRSQPVAADGAARLVTATAPAKDSNGGRGRGDSADDENASDDDDAGAPGTGEADADPDEQETHKGFRLELSQRILGGVGGSCPSCDTWASY